MGRPGEAVDAAVLASAIRVHRAIEADVRRVVARQDRLGSLDRDRCAALGDSVERLYLIKPFSLGHTLLEIEARGGGIAGRPASTARFDRHALLIRRS